jgi:hypothetical protein
MKKTNVNAIVFAQAQDNKKVVTANKYVAHALFVLNKPIWEELGATRDEGAKGLRLVFKSEKKAKDFIAQAITHIDEADYNKARKTEPKAKAEKKATAPAPAKGKKTEPKKAPRKSKGDAPTTAPNAKVSKKAEKVATPKKAKGNAELTDAQKKRLEICKMSILNRAASAYSIANGGEATNFKSLGKTEKDLTAYIPNAKAGLLKSNKWTKAVEMGITEDMLGF